MQQFSTFYPQLNEFEVWTLDRRFFVGQVVESVSKTRNGGSMASLYGTSSDVQPLKFKWDPLQEDESFFGRLITDDKALVCDLAELALEDKDAIKSRGSFGIMTEPNDGVVLVSIGKTNEDHQILSYHIDGRNPDASYMRINFQSGLDDSPNKRNFCLVTCK